jgi:prevent-host-death family protein
VRSRDGIRKDEKISIAGGPGANLIKRPNWPKLSCESGKGQAMQNMSAKDAKYGFGRLIDLARSEPVVVEKHGQPVVVVLAVEEYERLRRGAMGAVGEGPAKPGKAKKS